MKQAILLLFVFSFFSGNAQEHKNCSTTEKENEAIKLDPSILLKRESMRNAYKIYMDNLRDNPKQKTSEQIYRIPVVMHIMHNYGIVSNSTYQNFLTNREKYLLAVDEINRQFRNADSLDIEYPFNTISHDLHIEFFLAQKDPEGNSTKGILLHYNPGTESVTNTIKEGTQWDNKKYLNIWIVNGIESGAGGWSHLPGTIPDNLDGIVMLNNQLYDLGHECGHWLGLDHPWGGTNNSNLETNCNIDDGIDDTPNTRGQTTCNTIRNSCPNNTPVPFLDIHGGVLWPADSGKIHDNTQNVMDYAFCDEENFTDGQKEKVRFILANETANGRNIIWNESNLIATGICDTCGPYKYTPIALFQEDVETVVCVGTAVKFTDYSYNGTPTSWAWDFGDGNSSTEQSPSHSYDTEGKYAVKLTVSNANGSSSFTQEIVIGTNVASVDAPFYENFENLDFPTVVNPLEEWNVVGTKWKYTQTASYTGYGSMSLPLKSVGANKIYSLISPTIDFSKTSCTKMSFKYAYAKRSNSSKEVLSISVSRDCGEVWKAMFQKPVGTLETTDSIYPGTFIPTIDDWKEEEISLSAYTGKDHILIKFDILTGNGNFFYIDDVNVGCAIGTSVNENKNISLTIYPNPFENDINLKVSLLKAENINIEVLDILGQKVFSKTSFLTKGKHEFKINELETLEKGIYFVMVSDGRKAVTKKIVKY